MGFGGGRSAVAAGVGSMGRLSMGFTGRRVMIEGDNCAVPFSFIRNTEGGMSAIRMAVVRRIDLMGGKTSVDGAVLGRTPMADGASAAGMGAVGGKNLGGTGLAGIGVGGAEEIADDTA